MAIGNVVQQGARLYIYNEKNSQTGSISVGNGPKDGLKGYTSTTVNVQLGAFIYTYNERGSQISSRPA